MGKLRDLLFGNEEEEENMEENTTTVQENGTADLITGEMLVGEIIGKHPLAAQFLMECGMGCIYCPASQMESLSEACAVHGIDAEEITDALNDYLLEHAAG